MHEKPSRQRIIHILWKRMIISPLKEIKQKNQNKIILYRNSKVSIYNPSTKKLIELRKSTRKEHLQTLKNFVSVLRVYVDGN